MTTSNPALAIERLKQRGARRSENLALVRDAGLAFVNNPMFSLIGAVVTIELAQRYLTVPDKSLGRPTVPVYSGQSHVIDHYEWPRTPVISQANATLMETACFSSAALGAVGGGAGISGIINAIAGIFKK